jgi:5'-nucleotidase
MRRLALIVATAAVAAACATVGPAVSPSESRAPVAIQILAFNDFHGNLEPPGGSNGRLGDLTVGGAEYLATHIAQRRATNPHTVVVAAGDNIGASPLLSSLFHDEPTIRVLDLIGLDYSSPGNHEFDEGWREFVRVQRGGCHPDDGCRGSPSFDGAAFEYLAANVIVDQRGDTLFPATAMRTFDGVSVGFIGLVLENLSDLVAPSAIEGLTILPPAHAANTAAARLRADGADVVIAVIHEGGYPADGDDETCGQMTGGLVPVVGAMSADIDVVISGHTNRSYVCRMHGRLVTSTASYTREVTDIDLLVDPKTRRLIRVEAENVPVTQDVPRAPAVTALLEEYRPAAVETGRRTVGTLSGAFTRRQSVAGESTAGDLVADAYLSVARDHLSGAVDVALTNWGGLRSDLGQDDVTTPLTYAGAFELLPFGNIVVVKTLMGRELADLLEQQFTGDDRTRWRVLQTSHSLRYSWSAARPEGFRVDRASLRIDDTPVVPTQTYRVGMPDFVWNGGDGFSVAHAGRDPVVIGTDVDVFIDYLAGASPVSPSALDRVRREDVP